MQTRLRLFFEWGITFDEPYQVEEKAARQVAYASRLLLEQKLPLSSDSQPKNTVKTGTGQTQTGQSEAIKAFLDNELMQEEINTTGGGTA